MRTSAGCSSCSTEAEAAKPAHRAREVLGEFEASYGYNGSLPVPVEDIADSLARLLVQEVEDMSRVAGAHGDARTLSGILLCQPSNTIYVNALEARRSPGRRRFTIAHELGHWYLHATHGQGGLFERFCRGSDLESKRCQEGEANEFASALLMPSELLTDLASELRMNIPLLAKRFDVSVPAMRLRLITLDLLPAWMR
jgi:predicted transcriptional regulator